MNAKEIPVLLLTGYLGSGKTTLVNRKTVFYPINEASSLPLL